MKIRSEDENVYDIQPYLLTPENVQKLWRVFMKYDVILSDAQRGNEALFLEYLLSPSVVMQEVFLEGESVGVVFADTIIPMESASVHFLFTDLVMKGRQRLLLNMLYYFMETYELHRVNVKVPIYAFTVLNRIRKMNFWLEGRQRESIKWRGEWKDQLLFSVLFSELTEEALHRGVLDGDERRARWRHVLEDADVLASYFLRKEE